MQDILYSNYDGQLVQHQALRPMARDAFGVYETLLLREGVPELAALHWQRLFRGLELLGIPLPAGFDSIFLEQQLAQLAMRNGSSLLGRARIQVAFDREAGHMHYLLECLPLATAVTQFNEAGLIMSLLDGYAKVPGPAANCKLSHHDIPVPVGPDAVEYLICNTDGHIIETTIANLFWIKKDFIYTPPLSEGCVAGTMRHWLLAALAGQGYAVEELPCTAEALCTADEVFLVNSIRPMRWLATFQGRHFAHTRSKRLYEELMKPGAAARIQKTKL